MKRNRDTRSAITHNGLKNNNTSCYLNSVIQCLSVLTDFKHCLSSQDEQGEMNRAMLRLFSDLENPKRKYLSVNNIYKALNFYDKTITSEYMDDAMKVFTEIIKYLEQEVISLQSLFLTQLTIVKNDDCPVCGPRELTADLKQSFITLNSGGIEKTFSSPFTIQDLLENTLYNETISDCRKCKSKKSVTNKWTITETSPILVLYWSEWKSNLKVSIDISLNRSKNLNISEKKYKLTSLVLHMGTTNRGGHSTAMIRLENSDRWLYCDDNQVSEISDLDRVLSCNSITPFLIYYTLE